MSKSISWDGEYFILTAGSDASANVFTYAYSSDGVTWNKTAVPSNISAQIPYSTKYLGDNYEIVGNLTSTTTNASGNSVSMPCTINVVDGSYSVAIPNNLTSGSVIYDIECNLEQPNQIIFSKTVALALGNTNKIARSLDQGNTWVSASNPVFATSANDAVWNGRIWVAGGTGSGNTIATSLDGDVWVGRGNFIFSTACNGIDWSKTQNKYVAVGSGTNVVATSYDGIYWLATNKTLFTVGNDIKFNGSIWVAVGTKYGANGTIAYSSDGISWQYATQSFATAGVRLYYTGTVWNAFGQDPSYNFATSSDGITWTLSSVTGATELKLNSPTGQFADASVNLYPGVPYPLRTVSNAIISTVGRYVHNNSDQGCVSIQPISIACGEGSTTLAYSLDGIRWTAINNSIFTRANKAIWNGVLWVAVGIGSYCIATSYDGFSWTGRNSALFTECYDVAWNGSWFVAVGNGSTRIAKSSDGITWDAVSNAIITTQIHAIEWTGTVWMAYGSGTNTTAISSSADASAWTSTLSESLCVTDGSNVTTDNFFGNVSASAVTASSNSGSAVNAFDGQFKTNVTKWSSNTGLYDSSGAYIGTENSSGTLGEWIEVQLQNSRICKGYYLILSTNSATNNPRSWQLMGRNAVTDAWTALGDVFSYSREAYPNNSWKYPLIVEYASNANAASYSYYRMVFLSSFGGDSIEVVELGLLSDSTKTLSRFVRPIVLRDYILHPLRVFSADDGLTPNVCRITDLSGALMQNFVHSQFVNSIIYGLDYEPTACAFDGANHIVCSASGQLSYLSNTSAITNFNFDNALNSVTINTGMAGAAIYAACYNRKYFLLGGAGGAITYGSLSSSNIAPTFYPTNASSMFTNVYGLASNSGYGFITSPNVMYFKEDDKLSVVTPKFYDSALSADTSISFNVYKS